MKQNTSLRKLVFAFIFAVNLIPLFGYKIQDKTSVTISIISKESPGKIILSIKLLSGGSQILKVPSQKDLLVDYEDDKLADCFVEVYEIMGNEEHKQIPSSDYQSYNIKKQLLSLSPGQLVSYKFNIGSYYKIDVRHDYKIRIMFNLSKYNFRMNIYSNWLYFK